MSKKIHPEDYTPVYKPRPMSWLKLQYYRYQVTYGPYLFTPQEAFCYNVFIIVILFLTGWATKSILMKLIPSVWRSSRWILMELTKKGTDSVAVEL
ncbi:serine palmitoyl transferase A subunit [Schizosaccharomyces japonicus yFS275]|uniref:Serine palmitoyl transferase A subunit n=1 Tax=Schizosaccharomyces japonicus (strain yFS275 / FY16936) TaxID=402676 RepID=B6JZ33_SCHJY|nr:serine palmitoyl transferase A subunit [Schizosaccharomyces japonicus yFS275]EEB06801.1 serine palmitoyl transferase A subunit [Schizosaccharomyces japonicus yFS275]